MAGREKVYWILVASLIIVAFILMGRGYIINKEHFQPSDLNRDDIVDLTDLSILLSDLSIDNTICIQNL